MHPVGLFLDQKQPERSLDVYTYTENALRQNHSRQRFCWKIAILEAPDDAALAAALLSVGALGSVTTETCRTFPEEEFRQIIARLGARARSPVHTPAVVFQFPAALLRSVYFAAPCDRS
jgi:hypothetical protein